NKPVVVYYDNINHILRAAYAEFATTESLAAGFSSSGIACNTSESMGHHPNISVNGENFAITYQGQGGENLYLYQGSGLNNLFAGTSELIDAGVRTNQQLLVGAFSQPLYLNDTLYIIYADQTNNDLVISHMDNASWIPSSIASEGALGSFINALTTSNKIYTSTYKRYFDDTGVDLSTIAISEYDPASSTAP
ncbi:MAG: hypothetical protein QGI45_11195, partial [Myxococcota bacterium]|nr:hypothetical protein [Myxococcota bacterium]